MVEEQPKKVRMVYEEYQKLAILIINKMKEFEREGNENIQQYELVDKIVRDVEAADPHHHTSLEKVVETKRKVQQVIQYMIQKEGVIMVAQEAKTKDERYLVLDINVNMEGGNVATTAT